jgi:Protein of unknown function (DUF3617)
MRRNKNMKLVLLCAASGLIFHVAAQAAELPSRKPGLWEIKTSIEGSSRAFTVKQCIDAATDQLLQSSAGPFSASLCEAREAKKTESGMTIDSRCSVGGKAGRAHAAIAGSFEDAYTMTVTSEGGDLPPSKMTIEGKWLGACTAGLSPGDVIMGNGVQVNILQLQKRALTPADPMAPAK